MMLTRLNNYEIDKRKNIADYGSFYVEQDGKVCAVWIRAFSNDVNPSLVQYVGFVMGDDEMFVQGVPTTNYSFKDVFPDTVTIHPCIIDDIEVKYYDKC